LTVSIKPGAGQRADDPFGAGLVVEGLRDRFGEEGVFLDTWVLNRRLV
jgi:hypothetical protein